MSFVQTLEQDLATIWQDVEKLGSLIDGLIEAIITEEYQVVFKQEIVPLIKTAITNLQNEQPGINFQNIIPAALALVVPLLPEALADIEQGLIAAVIGYMATLAGVANKTGNAGNVTT